MKPHEMREMTADELQQHHEGLVDELAGLKIKLAAKQLDNPLRIRILRKEIARTRTVLHEKSLGAQPGQTLAQSRTEAKG